ncbi:MAG: hypothetical protein JXA09_08790 [Anaerolineae bacterium]|nr:hypothetical protein [Anaerolineae bacterium]
MNRIQHTLLALFAVALLVGCQAAPSPAAEPAAPTSLPSAPTETAVARAPDPRGIPATVDDVPRISPDELAALLASPQRVVVLDTRSPDEYAAGHIPGAGNMPLAQVDTLYSQLPREVKLVIYCA